MLSAKSKFFFTACSPTSGFSESVSRTIDLSHDEAWAVRAMIEFMYGRSYCKLLGLNIRDTDVDSETVGWFQDNASTSPETLDNIWKFDAVMYQMGDKYGDADLAKHAADAFTSRGVSYWRASHDRMRSCVSYIFATTTTGDDKLRQAVGARLAFEIKHGDAASKKAACQLTREIGGLVEAVCANANRYTYVWCLTCGVKVQDLLYCNACQPEQQNNGDWDD